jgi:hypothetical protein
LRPTAVSVEDTELGKKVTRKSKAITENISGASEIESVELEKDGRKFTIAKSIWEVEKLKPESIKDIKEGQPVLLRNPDLVGAKEV